MPQKETKRERREAAKRQRLEQMRRKQRKRMLRRIYTTAAIVGIVALIGGAIYLSGASGRKAKESLTQLAREAGCGAVQSPPNAGAQHIQAGAKGEYKSKPPTSGPHYNAAGQGPVATGIKADEIPNEGQVHNLEHGHIGVQYKESVATPIKEALEGLARESDNRRWVFVAPYKDMPYNVAFTAWDKLLGCENPTDPQKVAAAGRQFIEVYRNQGPESVPGA